MYEYKPTCGNLRTSRDVDGTVPYTPSYGRATVGAIHESPVYDSAFKKNAENQWYNKITHGSFKEDDWFKSIVKNQEKAQNRYTGTYGEKNGRKEYQSLHNHLINTPYNKIKEQEMWGILREKNIAEYLKVIIIAETEFIEMNRTFGMM